MFSTLKWKALSENGGVFYYGCNFVNFLFSPSLKKIEILLPSHKRHFCICFLIFSISQVKEKAKEPFFPMLYSEFRIVLHLKKSKSAMRKVFYLTLLFLFCYSILDAQQSRIDSLENILKTAKDDSSRANAFHSIGKHYHYSDYKNALTYYDSALTLRKKTGDKKRTCERQ